MFQEHVETLSEKPAVDLSVLSKESLIAVLRDRSLWPVGFGPWDYRLPNTCAMGLCRAKWGNSIRDLGLGKTHIIDIFVFGRCGTEPNEIADALEKM
jgi:hypothetical protein